MRTAATWFLAGSLCSFSCSTIYYNTMEELGWEKRHILAERVEETREEQGEAQEQFQTAFERFKEVTHYEGGDLERMYRRLSTELERSEKKAAKVRDRVASVDKVSIDLFEEWETEIGQISNPDLQRKSRTRLRTTRSQYGKMIAAMRKAEAKMDPVLQAFRDQVLFLKHNLNADAINSLEGTVASIEIDVQSLINELSVAIREADSFLSAMEG